MKKAKGFTLIELLVVVLIIGILAAIAIAQYQKAVMKSRVAGIATNVNALYQAVERYFLINGRYPPLGLDPTQEQMNEFLDIDITLGKNTSYTYYNGYHIGIRYNDGKNDFRISKGLSSYNAQNSVNSKNIMTCWTYQEEDSVCRSICGTLRPAGGAYHCIIKSI